MRHWLHLGTAVLLVAASAGARAADKNWTQQGEGLKISSSCAKAVEIRPGAAHQVTIAAKADHAEEIDRLQVSGGETASLGLGDHNCWGSGLFGHSNPTLILTITVPEGAPVDVKDGGVAHYTIDATVGDLKMALSGAGGVKAGNAKGLTLSLSGAGDADIGEVSSAHIETSGAGGVKLKAVHGNLEVRLSGANDITVGAIEAQSADLRISGHSDIKLGTGSIANLTLNSAGASDLKVEAIVGDANVSLAGAGEVRLAKLTGNINQSVAGAGKVIVGR